MNKDVEKILFTKDEIDAIVSSLANKISNDYRGRKLCLLCVLKGSLIFCADLMRKIDIPLELMCVSASSYKSSTVTSGSVELGDLKESIEGYDVIIVEDILDTGNTLSNLVGFLKKHNPASVAICTMLDKPSRRKVPLEGDYVGAVIPDEFVVGYGLDYDQKYRHLPYIGVLKPEIYNS
ncbi:MAG: hypoxanthine phosphoribosyltransferase [Ruminococcaceae bacterium]|nr:hypoxanthine phosphoribosyltransferase [Oscillospiraceae bacterium]